MEYRLSRLIGREGLSESWDEKKTKKRIELRNNSEVIRIDIVRKRIKVKIVGEGSIIIKRGKVIAKIKNNESGQIKEGDEIWLLNKRAEKEFAYGERENFQGAALKLEILNNRKEIFIKENKTFPEKSNIKINLILGSIVLGLLIFGTVFGYRKRSENEERKIMEETKRQIEKIESEIESVRTINMETALQLAKKADSIIDETKLTNKTYNDELSVFKTRLEEIKKGLGEESVDYEIVYDTTLINEGNKYTGMTLTDEVAYLWSSDLGRVDLVNIKLKSTEKIVSDERIKLWLGTFSGGGKHFAFDQNKIYEIKRNNLLETEIKEIKNIGDINIWNGIFYILNNDNQKIEKFSGDKTTDWLKEGINLKEETTGMAIDGDIWVLGKSGKIYHYSRGEEKKFEMSFTPSLTSNKALKTNDKVDFLAYVADNNVVYIYDKNGKILGKNNFGKISVNDIEIENQNRAILVLANDGKIYRIKIK